MHNIHMPHLSSTHSIHKHGNSIWNSSSMQYTHLTILASTTDSTLDSRLTFCAPQILFLQHASIIRTAHNYNNNTYTTTTRTTTTIRSASSKNNIAQKSPSSAHILRATRSASRSCYISTPASSLSIRISLLFLSVQCLSSLYLYIYVRLCRPRNALAYANCPT